MESGFNLAVAERYTSTTQKADLIGPEFDWFSER
jgi:hypothetical protein